MIQFRVEKIALLKLAFGKVHQSVDGINVACYCPKCAEDGHPHKLKLAVRLDDGRYHCWTCGRKGRSITQLFKRYASAHYERSSQYFPVTKQRQQITSIIDAVDVEVPSGFQLLAQCVNSYDYTHRQAIAYLFKRGLSIDDMWRYRLGISDDLEFKSRIIVPSFDVTGKLNFYVSRAINDRMWPRYKNADAKKQQIIFNEIDIDWTRPLVLTEGPFDVFKTTDNATCLLGNNLTPHFILFDKLVENSTPVILALDANEIKKTNEIAKLLHSYDVPVSTMSIAGFKDVGQMSKTQFEERRRNAVVWTPALSLRERIRHLGSMR